MSTAEMIVLRRPERRTHLVINSRYESVNSVITVCGRSLPFMDGSMTPIHMGGATTRLRNDLARELNDGNACKHCSLVAFGMLMTYATRDNGRPW